MHSVIFTIKFHNSQNCFMEFCLLTFLWKKLNNCHVVKQQYSPLKRLYYSPSQPHFHFAQIKRSHRPWLRSIGLFIVPSTLFNVYAASFAMLYVFSNWPWSEHISSIFDLQSSHISLGRGESLRQMPTGPDDKKDRHLRLASYPVWRVVRKQGCPHWRSAQSRSHLSEWSHISEPALEGGREQERKYYKKGATKLILLDCQCLYLKYSPGEAYQNRLQ